MKELQEIKGIQKYWKQITVTLVFNYVCYGGEKVLNL